ncbi:MAG: hypothetical protein ACREUC_08265 [Steroidobacteraceae bacterium]
MYWILAALFILVAMAVPRMRPLVLPGCIVLVAMLGWAMLQRVRDDGGLQGPAAERRGRPSSPITATQALPVSSVDAQNVRLSGGGAPFHLRGRIANRSADSLLKSATIRITRRDCYEGALDPTGCVKLWQNDHWIAITVPPGESRDFVEAIWMHGGAPRQRGTAEDTFELIRASGEPAPAVELPK